MSALCVLELPSVSNSLTLKVLQLWALEIEFSQQYPDADNQSHQLSLATSILQLTLQELSSWKRQRFCQVPFHLHDSVSLADTGTTSIFCSFL